MPFKSQKKSQTLDDSCDLFDLTNIIKEPTCFKKDCNPSLVDVILANKSQSCFKSLNFNTGVSDCRFSQTCIIYHFLSFQWSMFYLPVSPGTSRIVSPLYQLS
jgi:hypothetical protein